MKKYFIKNQIFESSELEKIKKIQFFYLGSATENESVLINLSISLNDKIPFFIFDYDRAGNTGLKKIQKIHFKNEGKLLDNLFFVNMWNEWDPEKEKVETQDLFKHEKDFEPKNKITDYFMLFCKKILNNKIVLNKKTIELFKKIFEKIIKNQK